VTTLETPAGRVDRQRPLALPLTARQVDVLALMARGWSNSAIARHLYITEKAVVQHTSQIYSRLDLYHDDETHRRVRAVLRYLRSSSDSPLAVSAAS
jgi:DNA-binding NarL/FixJ family response regulator